jgi:undecaprenyl-diphosphatase
VLDRLTSEGLVGIVHSRTIAFLAVLAVTLLFMSVLVRLPQTLELDIRATRFLQRAHGPVWNRLAGIFTWFGNTRVMVMLAVPIDAVLLALGLWEAALIHAATILAVPLNVWVKSFFGRERPGAHQVRINPGPRWGTSYPSGHAMASTVYYGFLATVVWFHAGNPVVRGALILLFSVIPPFTSLSRVYVGAHWLSDVVGGFAAGMILLVIAATLYPV